MSQSQNDQGQGQVDLCIPWDPIPPEQNVFFSVTVLGFDHWMRDQHDVATLLLYHSDKSNDLADPGVTTWRIDFDWIVAYRKRFIGWWKEAEPFVRPADRTKAFWEVAPSSWVRASIPPKHTYNVRHFSVAAEYDSYEILALSWTATQLDHDEAIRRGNRTLY